MHAVSDSTDPRIAKAIAHIRAAIDAINDTPEEGNTWDAKSSLLGALQSLIRERNKGT